MADNKEAERERFEAFQYARKNTGTKRATMFERLHDETYACPSVQRHWWTWQNATAALSELRAEVERLRVYEDRYRLIRAFVVGKGYAPPYFRAIIGDAKATNCEFDRYTDAARSSSPAGAAQGSAEGGV